MAKKNKLGKYEIFSIASEHIGMDLGNFSRLVKSDKIKSEDKPIFVKDEVGVYHKVGTSTIKVIDIPLLEETIKNQEQERKTKEQERKQKLKEKAKQQELKIKLKNLKKEGRE